MLKEKMKGCVLVNMQDRWVWSLEGSGDFLVASVRNLIDGITLSEVSTKTRWIKEVPIKINVHAWKVKIDCLPTRLNISRRGMDIDSILCPMCGIAVESTRHLFFTCHISRDILRKISRWWDIEYTEIASYEECFLLFRSNKISRSKKISLLALPRNQPTPSYKINNTERLTQKENEDKRAKNLCFYWDQKYAPGHKCPGQLYSLVVLEEEEEDEENLDELEGLEEEQVEEIIRSPQISLNALNGNSLIVDLKTVKINEDRLGHLQFYIWNWPKSGRKGVKCKVKNR
ncbi:RNA-directed DNA polymerase, eukaryota, partial [Tanacetum coccineum]